MRAEQINRRNKEDDVLASDNTGQKRGGIIEDVTDLEFADSRREVLHSFLLPARVNHISEIPTCKMEWLDICVSVFWWSDGW